jgi:hypothetical protein
MGGPAPAKKSPITDKPLANTDGAEGKLARKIVAFKLLTKQPISYKLATP